MSNNLPTTPGPYWWREKDGDEWEIKVVEETQSGRGISFRVRKLGGQWAKAHKPDEGQEAWAVKNRNGKLDVCWFDEQHTSLFVDQINEIPPGGYKMVPVTIYKREVER